MRHRGRPWRRRRRGKGLGVPVQRWLSGELADWARELAGALEKRGLVVQAAADRGEFDRSLFTKVSLELWFGTFIDRCGESPLS